MRATRTVGMLLCLVCCMGSVLAQSFTYQGMLKTSGIPANGNYDFQFSLWTAATGGSQVGSTLTRIGVSVSNGLFTTELDFGNVWDGSDRFLQIAVRPSGSGSYTTLSPRVKVNRAPYSQLAYTALSVPWSGITGIPAGFADGVDHDTTYTAGAGLQLVGNTFSIANGGVVSAMLADGAVLTSKLADGAVTSAKIADGTIVAADLADNAVTSAKIASGAVTTAKIGDAQVTDAKIVSVSWSKVTGAPSGFPPAGAAGGDLSGSYPNPSVAGLRGRAVSSAAPASGQVLKWDGSAWSPADDLRDALWQASGSNVFFNAGHVGIGTSSPGYRLHIETATGARAVFGHHTAFSGGTSGVVGQSDSTSGTGVSGWATAASGTTYGVDGVSFSDSGIGVVGWASATSGATFGVVGQSDSTGGTGVFGWALATTGITNGVFGLSNSTSGSGMFGLATATSGETIGVYGQSASTAGRGMLGLATATSGETYGGWFQSNSTSGTGVAGTATATSGTTYGVYGRSQSPDGYGGYFVGRGYFSGNLGLGTVSPAYVLDVNGRSRVRGTTGVNSAGIWYSNGTTNHAFIGLLDDNRVGMYGSDGAAWQFLMNTVSGNVRVGPAAIETAKLNVNANSTGDSATLRLHENAADFARLEFTNSNTARKWHIAGFIGSAVADDRLNFWNSSAGDILSITGDARVGIGTTAPNYKLHVSTSTTERAIYGHHTATTDIATGVLGQSDSTNGIGVFGFASATSGLTFGVFGRSASTNGYGVYSSGRFTATGTKSFQIDHPLDPENAFLNHFCFEGPEPQNIYNGVVVLDARGEAWVQLPDYFEAINRDPRYTLTPIGAAMPNLHVAVEVQGNRFKIAGGVPGKKVSWEVKAVRYDRWIQEYGFQSEEPKPRELRGRYLHPELYGQPKEMGIHYRPEPEHVERAER